MMLSIRAEVSSWWLKSNNNNIVSDNKNINCTDYMPGTVSSTSRG